MPNRGRWNNGLGLVDQLSLRLMLLHLLLVDLNLLMLERLLLLLLLLLLRLLRNMVSLLDLRIRVHDPLADFVAQPGVPIGIVEVGQSGLFGGAGLVVIIIALRLRSTA